MAKCRDPLGTGSGIHLSGGIRQGVIIMLAVISAVQFTIVARDYAVPWLWRIWQLKDQDAWIRAAALASWLHEPDVEYIKFLRAIIPNDALVVVPPNQSDYGPFKWINNVSYNLFPRTVVRCVPLEWECVERNPAGTVFFLAINDFPDPAFLDGIDAERVMFDSKRGVIWLPGSSEGD